jgi:hypothetical protein
VDPNVALRRLRELANIVLNDPTEEGNAGAADEMAELFLALDEWLKQSGFKPIEWSKQRWS